MKLPSLLAVVMTVVAGNVTTVFAQFAADPYQVDNNFVHESNQMMQMFEQQNRPSFQMMMQYHQQQQANLVNRYRQATGDYQSTEQEMSARITAE